jgi:hypothetical protein
MPLGRVATVAVLALAAACSSGSSRITDPRHPGDATELLRRVRRDGPILVKGTHPYWLIKASRAPIAMDAHLRGNGACILRPIRIHSMYSEFEDCTGGSYDSQDLWKYPSRVAADGSMTVDLSRTVEVNPSG